jgi:uncharacterized protein (TIGR03382 family)
MRKLVVLAAIAGWVIIGGFSSEASANHLRVVPLPSTLPLLGLGLALLGAARRK